MSNEVNGKNNSAKSGDKDDSDLSISVESSDDSLVKVTTSRLPSQHGVARFTRTPRAPVETGLDSPVLSPGDLESDSNSDVLITEIKDSYDTPDPEIYVEAGSTSPATQTDTNTQEEKEQEQEVHSDNEWDTDLEAEEEPEEHDTSGRSSYVKLCEELGIIPVSYFMRHITDPELTLRYHGLGPMGARAIARTLTTNITLDRLNLTGNWIQAEGGIHMAGMMLENEYISEVVLAENKLGSVGGYHMAKMLIKNTGLRKVDLSANEFLDKDAGCFAEVLDQNRYLKELNLSGNFFGEEGGEILGPVIGANDILNRLDLSWNHIRMRGAVAIAKGLTENVRLKSCNISWNGFGTEGGLALAEAIEVNQSLQELDISGNRLGIEVAVKIAKALRKNEELRTLKMGNNPISTGGAIAIAKAANENEGSVLALLDLSDIPVEYEYLRIVAELQRKRPFEEFHGVVLRSGNTIEDLGKPQVDPNADRKDPLLVLRDHILVRDLRLLDILKRLDVENRLSVSQEQFASALMELGVAYTKEHLNDITKKLDKNDENRIYYGDIVEVLASITEPKGTTSAS